MFGGILGDDPPKDTSKVLRDLQSMGASVRHLGDRQMTTDTAVHTTQLIVEKQQKIEDIPFIEDPEFQKGPNDFACMPFRYVADEAGRPLIAPGMAEEICQDFTIEDFL
eukprot:Colp12_sorted_trinity150504_noHs@27121